MSFDYFNTSYLAFGQKLYSAFATLDSLAKEAKLNIDKIMTYQSLFDDYLNKNYFLEILILYLTELIFRLKTF